MIVIKPIVLFALAASAGQPGGSEETCFLLRGESRVEVPGMSVIRQTSAGSFEVSAAKPGDAIMCEREDLLPQANDFKVLVAGFPLIIESSDGRVAALELESGLVQFRTLSGEFTTAEIADVRLYVDAAAEAINASSSP